MTNEYREDLFYRLNNDGNAVIFHEDGLVNRGRI